MEQKLDDMLKIYQENLEKEPNNPVLLYNLGVIYFLQKDFKNAENSLKKAIESDFKRDNAQLGSMFYQMENYQEAIKAYEMALEEDPNEENLYICLSEIYKKINDKKNLQKTLQNGVKTCKNGLKIQCFLGNFYFEEQDYKNAILEYQKINPKTYEIFLSIANAYVMLDDIKNALKNYKKAYELAPDNAIVMNLYNDALNEFFRRKDDHFLSK